MNSLRKLTDLKLKVEASWSHLGERDFSQQAAEIKSELMSVLDLLQRMFSEDIKLKGSNFEMMQAQLQQILMNYQNGYEMEEQEDF